MKDPFPRKQNRLMPFILGIVLLVCFTVLVLLQTSNLWKAVDVGTASGTLLLYALSSLNFIALIVFGFIFLRSIVKLARERRALQLGARLKTKLLLYFVAISILPIFAMAGFSYLFMNRALERWFTQIPENVVVEARELQERTNKDRYEQLEETARMIVSAIGDRKIEPADLEGLLSSGDLAFVGVFGADNTMIVSSGGIADASWADEMELIKQGRFDDARLRDGQGIDAAVAAFPDGRKLIISPNIRSEESTIRMVDDALAEFDRLKDEGVLVRQIGLLTLGVLTFLLIFASSWTAFYIARGLTVPIRALAEGAEKIAQGGLGHTVDVPAEDELELLVTAFNGMSAKLEANSTELTERRRYIETVLLSLPTGVISLDNKGVIGTINPSAKSILKLERGNYKGKNIAEVLSEKDIEAFGRLISRARRIGHASDQTQLSLNENADGDSSVAIIATALPEQSGTVLVIEDLSELIAAQRASAWREVARRMAHEIKNPLTPIQLSAERIVKRFDREAGTVGNMDTGTEDQTARIVREGTDTILREVQSLKSMVDEFSRFARLPDAKLEPGNVNEIIDQVLALYEDRLDGVQMESELAPELPGTMLDAEQMKRVFVNLVDNAVEAFEDDGSGSAKKITVNTRHDAARDIVVAEVSDNGRGIDPADLQKLFQPYFSTKGRGTGLGLAIVHRIIAEHNGKIKVAQNQPRGARFIIELPMN